jgi:hypothetical protein
VVFGGARRAVRILKRAAAKEVLMNRRRTRNLRLLIGVLVPLAAACGSSSTPTRTISGQLQAGAYHVNNPVVNAQAADHRVFFTHVNASGRFQLNVPTGTSYRLLLANTTHSGYRAISHILWPSKSRWAKVGSGPAVHLTGIHPRGTPLTSSMGGNSQGENDDDQGEDEDDGAVICKAGDETESDDDDNDQGEQEGINNDDNENENEMEAENHSSSMCGCVATGHESDDDDEMEGAHPVGAVTADGGCPAPQPPPTNPPPPPTNPPPPPTNPPPPPTNPPPSGSGGPGAPCHVNGDCATGLVCVASTCQTPGPLIP